MILNNFFSSVALKSQLDFALAQNGVSGAMGATKMYVRKPFSSGGPIYNSSSSNNNNKDYFMNKNTATTTINQPKAAVVSNEELRKWKAYADERIYVIPVYFPKCPKRSVITEESPEVVLDKANICFKKLNIQASFDPDLPSFGLVLRTLEQLELSMIIWYADKSRSKLYVEVEKRRCGKGCTAGVFPFQYICRILKCLSCDKQTLELDDDAVCMPSHLTMMRQVTIEKEDEDTARKLELLVGDVVIPKEDSTMAEDKSQQSVLEIVGDHLESSMTWNKAMETLTVFSDSSKTDSVTAQVVSKAILLGELNGKLTDILTNLTGGARVDTTEHLSAYQKDCILQGVLTCLVNAIEVQVKASAGALLHQFTTSSSNIVETLIYIMRHANTKPHHAYLAVKALFLLSSETSVRNLVSVAMMKVQEDAAPGNKTCAVLQQAHQVGAQSHGLLEKECKRLQQVLKMRW